MSLQALATAQGSGLPIFEEDKRRPQGARCDIVTDPCEAGTPPSCNETRMGEAVAIDGDFAVVGASVSDQLENGSTIDVGVAFVYERDDTTSLDDGQRWFQRKILQHQGVPGTSDRFGFSVGISGDRIIVGAPFDRWGGCQQPPPGQTTVCDFRGSAFVFKQSGTNWIPEDTGLPSKALRLASPTAGDFFGRSVDIENFSTPIRAVVGANEQDGGRRGSVYVFEKPGSAWVETAELPEASDVQSGDADEFGFAVAIDGSRVAVGARKHDHGQANDAGGAYVYAVQGSSWVEEDELEPSTPQLSGDEFGNSIDIEGDTAVVGSWRASRSGQTAAELPTSSRGTEQNGLSKALPWQADSPVADERFGNTVSISGDRIVIGTLNSENAYLFVLDQATSTWEQQVIFTSGNASSSAEFGYAGAISGDHVVIGAPSDDTCNVLEPATVFDPPNDPVPTPGFLNSGAAYFFAPFPEAREFYGTPEPTGLSCNPATSTLAVNGEPSMTSASPFWVTANRVTRTENTTLNQCVRTGTFLWGISGRDNASFGDGTVLVHDWKRAVPMLELDGAGLPCPQDANEQCDLTISLDFNDLIQQGQFPAELFVGQKVNAQWVLGHTHECPGSACDQKEMTDAVEFIVGP